MSSYARFLIKQHPCRKDIKISTLRDYLESLGMGLEIAALPRGIATLPSVKLSDLRGEYSSSLQPLQFPLRPNHGFSVYAGKDIFPCSRLSTTLSGVVYYAAWCICATLAIVYKKHEGNLPRRSHWDLSSSSRLSLILTSYC